MQIMGPRWTPEIIRALLAGTSRFGEIRHAVPGLSDRMLSERLRTLEAEGLVSRSVVPARPPRVDYHLTDKGKALASVVAEVARWADTWLTDT
jgi:DNA-binding HxlR family transcriptional regulator